MKKHHILFLALSFLLACQPKHKNEGTGATSSPPSLDEGNTPNLKDQPLKSILDSTVIRMSRVQLTNHPVKDFALLMRVHHDGIRQFIDSGAPHIQDPHLKTIVSDIDKDVKDEVVMLNRFIIDNRFQKQPTQNPVSNKLMEAMSTIKQPFPASGDGQKDFAVLLIQLLQTANNMVQIMQEENADYEISGFAEMMVPRNNDRIEKLRGWVSPGVM